MPIAIELPDAGHALKSRFMIQPLSAESVFEFGPSLEDFVSTGVTSTDEFESVLDGDPVIKSFKNMTINAGHIVRPTNRCKGMFIYVEGDLIVNGQLTMTARGANAPGKHIGIDPKNKWFYFNPTDIYPEDLFKIGPTGGTGGARRGGNTGGYYQVNGNAGNPGVNGACGGGGSGGCSLYICTGYSGAGAAGTCFSGGAGGGGTSLHQSSATAPAGGIDGGAGGRGYASWNGTHPRGGGGGAGNSGGYTHLLGSATRVNGSNGTGGLLVLIVKGKILVNPTGIISSDGADGGYTTAHADGRAHGGGSGGGAIHLIHRGALTNQGIIRASGGRGNVVSGFAGGNGGAGSIVESVW